MAHVSIKIDGACLVSGGVNSSIQFPPGVELHRQGWKAGRCACVCVCVPTHSRAHVWRRQLQHGQLHSSSVKRSYCILRFFIFITAYSFFWVGGGGLPSKDHCRVLSVFPRILSHKVADMFLTWDAFYLPSVVLVVPWRLQSIQPC